MPHSSTFRSQIEDDGSIFYCGKTIKVPNIKIETLIGTGANGFVFRGLNPYLHRTVAVKIWAKIKDMDERDKITQGTLEIQKAAMANSQNVVGIYDAGLANGYFYS